LILVDAEVVIGGGVSVSGVGCVPSSTKVRIPVMKPLDGLECLEKHTQLKCYYKPEGIDPVKKAKLS
jgi:tetrahydromethanopterin S-methyltransferase subunit D